MRTNTYTLNGQGGEQTIVHQIDMDFQQDGNQADMLAGLGGLGAGLQE